MPQKINRCMNLPSESEHVDYAADAHTPRFGKSCSPGMRPVVTACECRDPSKHSDEKYMRCRLRRLSYLT